MIPLTTVARAGKIPPVAAWEASFSKSQLLFQTYKLQTPVCKCHDCLSVNKNRGTDYREKLGNCHPKRLLRASEENPWNAECQEAEEGLVIPSAPSNCAGLQLLTEMIALCCQGTSFKVKALILNCIAMKTFSVNKISFC